MNVANSAVISGRLSNYDSLYENNRCPAGEIADFILRHNSKSVGGTGACLNTEPLDASGLALLWYGRSGQGES